MVTQRQSPEQSLRRAHEEELQARRGKLKIYLGAAPGVGKTYEMLQDAIPMRNDGFDIIIGIVESHGRQEIEAMTHHFDILPRQTIIYHDKPCQEFDLDAALQRHPGLILMDEMAHANVPGLRHSKRWQDINELLDHGIDVCTTLNIQHIESIKDAVIQIIHAPIKETVPDSMIELANTIELVDLPPEELLKRLQEGKIYFPQQAELAAEHFFRKGNLIALRELALRVAAERVGTDVLLYRQGEGIKQIWPTKDKILVCVGWRPESLKLLRAAKRIATSLQAEWLAIYVDKPSLLASTAHRDLGIQHLQFAERLGAETHVLTGTSIVDEILNFAREHNVTQIMIRKNIRNRWKDWFHINLADELLRQSGEIDVYIMTGTTKKTLKQPDPFTPNVPWKAYGFSLAMVALTTGINLWFYSPDTARNVAIIYYILCVALVALLGRIGPSIVASFLSVFAYDYFFIPPYFDLTSTSTSYSAPLLIMLLVTQVIGHLTVLARRQVDSARAIQEQTTALYTLSRQLTQTRGVDDLLSLGTKYLANVFHSDVMALLPKGHHLHIHPAQANATTLDAKELGIAQWVYDLGQPAGLGTDTLSFSNALYLPMMISNRCIGVLRIEPKSKQLHTPEQMRLLDSCVNQLALALDIARLQEITRKKELKLETGRALNSLLHSIANDLQHPLTALTKAIHPIKNTQPTNKDFSGIQEDINQLQRLNHNLLQLIELESLPIEFNKTSIAIRELLEAVIHSVTPRLNTCQMTTRFDESLPTFPLDKRLMQNAIEHLIDHAVKLAPQEPAIELSAHQNKATLVIGVHRPGLDIPEGDLDKLLDTLSHSNSPQPEGTTGLELTLCHKIVIAHGGQIQVRNIQDHGAVFYILLPVVHNH